MNPTSLLCIGLFIFACAPALAADAPPPILTNGNFESAAKGEGWPEGWPHPAGARWEVEEGNHFLRLAPETPGQTITVFRTVPIRPEHKALELTFRERHTDVKPGPESWHDARLILHFKDAAGRERIPAPPTALFRGTSKGWTECRARMLVPENATVLEFMPAMFQVQGGTWDLDDIALVPIDPDLVKNRAATRATRTTMEAPAVDPAKLPPELHVAGTRLETADGKAVRLQGLNIASLEWTAAGENVLKSVGVAVDEWKANVIRLPVKDDFWFGEGPWQKDGGKAYRKLVDEAIQAVAGRGAYVILDLHRFGAPTGDSVDFWKDAAARYKDHPAVLFDLLNEPHDVSWEVWRDGGTVEENKGKTAYESPGMQRLLATVREAGAKNVVVVGGLGWSYDLSGVVKGFALEEKGGRGIMYATHIYNWHRGWKENVLGAAEKYPILVGEVGCDSQIMPFVPKEQQEDPMTWAPDMIGFIQANKLNWTAWCFHPSATPRMILGWDYKPTPFWGEFVKQALGGKQFEMKKMR